MRKEQRAAELADLREKTKTFMRSFEAKASEVKTLQRPWFEEYMANLAIRNIGVAFPLTLEQDFELPRVGNRETNSIRAFLFSIKSLSFGAQRGENGQAIMRGFSFQFVPQ
jgi:hypothetical protein